MNSREQSLNKPTNRPGLPQIVYRIADYAAFRQRLLAALPQALRPPTGGGDTVPLVDFTADDEAQDEAQITSPFPSANPSNQAPLANLTTRDEDDPAIALLDAWAVVADVLTFYQERIANEGYLRTSTERRSVLELARAIGYELNPGVAASTYLTFSVEDTPTSPRVATIPQGTQIMSVPGPGNFPRPLKPARSSRPTPIGMPSNPGQDDRKWFAISPANCTSAAPKPNSRSAIKFS
jgi:hypothetical protein